MNYFTKFGYSLIIVLGLIGKTIGNEEANFQLTNTAASNAYPLDRPNSNQLTPTVTIDELEQIPDSDSSSFKRKRDSSAEVQIDAKITKFTPTHNYTFHNIPQDLLDQICSFLSFLDHRQMAQVSKWYNQVLQAHLRHDFSQKQHTFNCREETAVRFISYVHRAQAQHVKLRVRFIHFPTFSKAQTDSEKDFFTSEALNLLKHGPIEGLSMIKCGTYKLDFTKTTLNKLTKVKENQPQAFADLKRLELRSFRDFYDFKINPSRVEFVRSYMSQLTHLFFKIEYLLPFLEEIEKTKSPLKDLKKLKIFSTLEKPLEDIIDFQKVNNIIDGYIPQVKIFMEIIGIVPYHISNNTNMIWQGSSCPVRPSISRLSKIVFEPDFLYPNHNFPKQIAQIPEVFFQNDFYSFFLNKNYFFNPYAQDSNNIRTKLFDKIKRNMPMVEKIVEILNLKKYYTANETQSSTDEKSFSIVNTYSLNEEKEMILKHSRRKE